MLSEISDGRETRKSAYGWWRISHEVSFFRPPELSADARRRDAPTFPSQPSTKHASSSTM